ncbi:MAG: chromosomal replication initiator protein DnaA [Candidatus Gottesmanbacteria bacterium]|nr:chromosomal replication initiator protein DnaA [Candidatus Gottesmanbacteria bacterium]
MDLEKLWKTTLAEIEVSVSRVAFHTQFKGSSLVSLASNVATVGISNAPLRALVESRYYSLIKSILDHHTNENISLIFVVAAKHERMTDEDAGPLFSSRGAAALSSYVTGPQDTARRLHIRADASFDNFAVSTTNQLAYAAATAVAKSPGGAYNPLFLYGGVGVGKTHLMHAVANAIIAKKPTVKLVYCMGEEFTNEIVEAIQNKTNRQFRQKYRSAELFLVDDVQFIAGKQQTQEEFFHTFNALHREGVQIILTSDRPPPEIAKLDDRLRSRFEGGMTVDIAPPNFELRVAIVNIKSAALGISVPSEAAQLVAANLTDTRAIEGFLRKLTAPGVGPATPELVASLLGSKAVVGSGGIAKHDKRVPAAEVLEVVAAYYSIKSTTIKSPKRDRPISRPRQIIMYLCKTELGLTLEDIGGLLGGRDHTTIMHGVETITQELSVNERLRSDVEGIKKKLWA